MKQNIILLASSFLLFLAVYFLGFITVYYKFFPYPQLMHFKENILKQPTFSSEFNDLSDKEAYPCNDFKQKKKLVILTLGQSNSANHGGKLSRYRSQQSVFNLYKGGCYKAEDPMLGATGESGSLWARMGDLIVEHSSYDAVFFKTIGIGASSIAEWSEKYRERIQDAIMELHNMGFEIDLILWHQGEKDNGKMKAEVYKRHFLKIVQIFKEQGVDKPFSIALASYAEGTIDKEIRTAQHELIASYPNIFKGVDSDQFIGYRDGVHFNAHGLDTVAKAWFMALIESNLLSLKNQSELKSVKTTE
jgi:hypothetical protein